MMKKPTLYTKNEKGRYEVYREQEPAYDNKLYRKVGRRYEPCSMLMTNDLPEGVWVVVKHKSHRSSISGAYLYEQYMCMKAGDIQEVPLAQLGGMERLVERLVDRWDDIPRDASCYDIAHAIVAIICDTAQEK